MERILFVIVVKMSATHTLLGLTKCSSAVEYSKPFDKSDVESLNIVCISKLRINLKLPR